MDAECKRLPFPFLIVKDIIQSSMSLQFYRQPRSNSVFRIQPELKIQVLIGLLLSAISALTILVFYSDIQPEVPLFYSLTRPEEQVVAKQWLFFIPAFSAVILFLHAIWANALSREDMDSAKIFIWSTVGIIGMLLLGLMRILFIIM